MGAAQQLARLLTVTHTSQAEVARRLGVSKNWISNRVIGEVHIRADEVPALAKALGVPISEFFADVVPTNGRLAGAPYPESSPTPYGDVVVRELSIELPEAEQEYVKELLALRRRFRQRIEEEERRYEGRRHP